MKSLILLLSCSLLLGGCVHDKQTKPNGPLSKIRDFSVVPFFSPYEAFDQELVLTTLVDYLKTIGDVKIIEESILTAQPLSSVFFLLSLSGFNEKNNGSIEIICPVEAEINKFKTSCSIWRTEEHPNSVYPVLIEDKIDFRTAEGESDSTTVLKKLIATFADEYQHCNAENAKPLFYIYKKGLMRTN